MSARRATPAEDVVRRIRWQSYRVPFRRSFSAAHGTQRVREGLIVMVETACGAVGVGEAAPLPGYYGGSVEETASALASLSRGLVGQCPETAWQAPPALAGITAGSEAAARCALETATADLAARATRQTMAAWLAHRAGLASPVPRLRVPVNGAIDASLPSAAASEARRLVRAGFRTLKVKVGMDDGSDVARLTAIRDAIGPEIAIRIDANGAWEPHQAGQLLGCLKPLHIELCEQPLSPGLPGSMAAHATIRSRSSIAIALDESCRSEADIAAIVESGAADVVVIKPMACGLRTATSMVARARQAGLPVIVTSMFDTGIGVAAAVHLAAITADPPLPCGLATLSLLEDDLAHGVPRIRAGAMSLGARFGLGVRLDQRALARFGGGLSGSVPE